MCVFMCVPVCVYICVCVCVCVSDSFRSIANGFRGVCVCVCEHFPIVKEDMVFEEGKFYTIMDVRKAGTLSKEEAGSSVSEKDFRYSRYLRECKNPVFLDYLKDEEEKLLSLKANLEKQAENSERAKESLREVEEKLSMNQEVQHEVQ